MRNRTYGGVRGRKTKVGRKLLRFPPTRLYSVPPETLNDLNDLDLNDRKEKIFHSYFFTLNNVIMCFFHFFICTFA